MADSYTDTSKLPRRLIEPGYYYHYKHDASGEVNNYAYYIYGVGHHTEDDAPEFDRHMQAYRPLYDAFVYKNGKMLDLRPHHMFFEQVEWQGKLVPRFTKITDPTILAELKKIRRKMYPEEFADWQ
jgi:hypothetical protein